MFMNGALTVLPFSGVLWTICPFLFGVSIGYAVVPLVNSILSKINDLRGGLAIRYLHVKNVQ
jgi:hypothetical protein